jgi:hypothetical protein
MVPFPFHRIISSVSFVIAGYRRFSRRKANSCWYDSICKFFRRFPQSLAAFVYYLGSSMFSCKILNLDILHFNSNMTFRNL